jgi:hypothetical protein
MQEVMEMAPSAKVAKVARGADAVNRVRRILATIESLAAATLHQPSLVRMAPVELKSSTGMSMNRLSQAAKAA